MMWIVELFNGYQETVRVLANLVCFNECHTLPEKPLYLRNKGVLCRPTACRVVQDEPMRMALAKQIIRRHKGFSGQLKPIPCR